ncbi:MAG: hypothetical protein R6W76_22335 [Caldilinea sp.]
MPCLFALLGAFAPRLSLFLLWIFTPLVNSAFSGWMLPWLWSILGVVFLPFTTLMYVLVVGPLGETNFWGWIVVFLGLLIDLRAYSDAAANRNHIPGMGTYTRQPV